MQLYQVTLGVRYWAASPAMTVEHDGGSAAPVVVPGNMFVSWCTNLRCMVC
ncbi:MAG: hypothetical protein ABSG30_09845 [Steroidobacteraceae bacterium]